MLTKLGRRKDVSSFVERCRSPQARPPLAPIRLCDGAASCRACRRHVRTSRDSSSCPRSTTLRARRTAERDAPEEPKRASGTCRGDPGPAQALRAPDRRRAAAHRRRGARAGAPQGCGGRGCEAEADRVEPAPRHVDHAQLHEGGRAAARPDPGGQPRPDAGGREVRLHAGLQALHLRDLVDPPVGHARARRAGPHDPAARPRRRPGAARDARPAGARAEAEPRPDLRRDRDRDRLHAGAGRRAAGAGAGPRQPRDAGRRRREHVRRPRRGHEQRRPGRRDGRAPALERGRGGARPAESAYAPRPLAALRPRRDGAEDAGRGRSRPGRHARARAPARITGAPRATHGRAGLELYLRA